jgi:replicative DNA helicase
MATTFDILALSQKEIEHEFVAVVNKYPLYALQQCGWMSSALMLDLQVRKYWDIIRERLEPSMDDDTAMSVAMQAALESGLNEDMHEWGRRLDFNATPQAYAQEISRRAYLVKIGSRQGDLWKCLNNNDDIGAKEIITELSEFASTGAPSSMPILTDIHERFIRLANEGQRSIETFIPPLDLSLGGLEKQTLTVLAARPSMGKTAMALQIARNIAESGKDVIFFSLEMSAIGLWARIACPLAKVQWRDVLANKINADQRRLLKERSLEIADRLKNNLVIMETRQTTESIWRTVATNKPKFIVIDHLRYVKDKGENENKRQGAICEALHDLAKSYDIPVLLLVQLNRGVEAQNDKRPGMKDLRDSGEIEETADNILMLYRDSYYNPLGNQPALDPTELWIRKFRNGPSGTLVHLQFDKQREWFENANV